MVGVTRIDRGVGDAKAVCHGGEPYVTPWQAATGNARCCDRSTVSCNHHHQMLGWAQRAATATRDVVMA